MQGRKFVSEHRCYSSILRRRLDLGWLIRVFFLRWLFRNFRTMYGVVLIIGFRLLAKVRKIHAEELDSARVGNFLVEICTRITDVESGRRSPTVFCLNGVANSHLNDLVSRHNRVANWLAPMFEAQRILSPRFPSFAKTLGKPPESRADLEERMEWPFDFSTTEYQLGLDSLTSLGWRPDEPIVTLLVRDSAYLNSLEKDSRAQSNTDWSYHSYRDSAIGSYREAIMYLLEQGAWVFRMGKVMENEISINHVRFVDYASLPVRTDFLDVWLMQNCSACISTSTGLDILPIVGGIPSLMINCLPLAEQFAKPNIVLAPKRLYHASSRQQLTLPDYLDACYFRSHEYASAGISISDLASYEIQEIVEEFWLWSRSAPGARERQSKIQAEYQKACANSIAYKRYHHIDAQYSILSTAWSKGIWEDAPMSSP